MLDPDDELVIKESKTAGSILVTWDRVVRQAAGGKTPYEVMDIVQATAPKKGEDIVKAQAELHRLRSLSPQELTSLSEAGNKTYQFFQENITVDKDSARLIRYLRVKRNFSWRAVARRVSEHFHTPFGSNQLAGMVICQKAAKLLGEDFLKPPWN
jgi:hypothetical protein